MKNKIIITIVALVIALPFIGECGRTAPTAAMLAQPMAHPNDIRFENCMVCHVADQLAAKPLPHTGMGFTNKDCIKSGCHKLQGAATVTPPPPTTQPPAITTQPPTITPVSTPAGSTAPTGSTTPPPSSNSTTTPPTSVTTPAGKVLNLQPKSAIKSAHPDSMKTMCLFCHAAGAGALQYPLPPNWDGSAVTPGPWVVEKSSPADHAGRTDPATCLQAGCHVIG
jgi:hypothetical protein